LKASTTRAWPGQRRQGGGEASVVGDIVEHQVAADPVETLRQLWQRTAQVGHAVVDGTVWVLLTRHLYEARGEIQARDVRATGCQNAGQEPLATAGVEHLPTGEVAQEIQHAAEDGIALQVCLLAPGDKLAILRRILVPRVGVRCHRFAPHLAGERLLNRRGHLGCPPTGLCPPALSL
jgi:hypothetical protein